MSRGTSNLNPFAFVADLWRHRELLWQFTQREVQLRHRGSHLGLIWSFLNPLLMLGLYVFVFGYIFGGSFGVLPHETRVDFALGVFLGLAILQFFSETFSVAPNVIVGNPNFVKKVVFPLEILPAASVGSAAFHLMTSLILVLAGAALFGNGFGLGALWLPIIVFPVALTALGLAWVFAALGVFLRDLVQLTQFLSLALMYASAVFFPVHKIPPAIWEFLRFNPLLLAIELSRDAVLWEQALNFKHLAYLYAMGLLFCYAGYFIFRRLKPAFADVL